MILKSFNNIIQVIEYRAKKTPKSILYTFLDNSEKEINLTYIELLNKIKRLSYFFRLSNIKNPQAILLFPAEDSIDFIISFFTCLYTGIIAIPCPTPRINQSNLKIKKIIENSKASTIISNTITIKKLVLKSDLADIIKKNCNIVNINDSNKINVGLYKQDRSKISLNDIAFLQYTSGSTGNPKGVIVTHKNILANQEMIKEDFQHDEKSTFAGWLPLFHDMGLIGNIIQPLYIGARSILMTPSSFLTSPLRWLKIISQYKVHTSGAPNFAYLLCVNKYDENYMKNLDLSSWKIAFNGAEPIDLETMKKFYNIYKKYGFKMKSFFPCYGLAEATLFVSGNIKNTNPKTINVNPSMLLNNKIEILQNKSKNFKSIVSSGIPNKNQDIRIINPKTLKICNKNEIGEIIIKGLNITSGYWNNIKASQNTFNFFIPSSNKGPFLRTGDLGFICDQHLYITGRVKDLIIIRGRNFYPQDIEKSAIESHILIHHVAAAFSIKQNEEEKLVLLAEINKNLIDKSKLREVLFCIKSNIIEEYGVQPYNIVLLKRHTLPLTSSGKIQRFLCKEYYNNNKFTFLIDLQKSNNTTFQIPDKQSNKQLQIKNDYHKNIKQIILDFIITINKPFNFKEHDINLKLSLAQLGLDSIHLTLLSSKISKTLNIVIPITDLFEFKSVNELIKKLKFLHESSINEKKVINKISNSTHYPLSYGQQAIYFMEKFNINQNLFTIFKLCEVIGELDLNIFKKALHLLVDRHPMLRVKFSLKNGIPYQYFSKQKNIDKIFIYNNFKNLTQSELKAKIEDLQNLSLKLEDTCFKINLLQYKNDSYFLLLTIHHIISDLWSLSIFIKELDHIYNRLIENKKIELSSLTYNYLDFINYEKDILKNQTQTLQYKNYWKEILKENLSILTLPKDNSRPVVQTHNADSIFFKINKAHTLLLCTLSQSLNSSLYNILLTVYYILLYKLTYQKKILVGSPVSGRSNHKFDNIIGYFVNIIVLNATLNEEDTFKQVVEKVKKSIINALSSQNYPYNKILEDIRIKRDPSFSPVYQAMFTLQKAPYLHEEGFSKFALNTNNKLLKLNNFTLKSLKTKKTNILVDLDMALISDFNQLEGYLNYNTDIFCSNTIKKFTNYYLRIIKQIVSQPEIKIKDISLLTSNEIHRATYKWNKDKIKYNNKSNLYDLFENFAINEPNTVAIVEKDKKYTYNKLNENIQKLSSLISKIKNDQN